RPSGLLLHQRQYALDILERAGMTDCKPCSTPVDTQTKLSADLGDPVADPTAYRSLAGALQYLTFTRPDLTYAVQQVCLHMHDPRESHLAALKRLLRYVRGTVDLGLGLHRSSSLSCWSTPTLTGLAARTLVTLLPATPSFWAATWSPNRPSGSRLSTAPMLRRSTGLLLTAWRRRPGYDSSWRSSTARSPRARSSTATTSAPCISPPTPFSISGRSM